MIANCWFLEDRRVGPLISGSGGFAPRHLNHRCNSPGTVALQSIPISDRSCTHYAHLVASQHDTSRVKSGQGRKKHHGRRCDVEQVSRLSHSRYSGICWRRLFELEGSSSQTDIIRLQAHNSEGARRSVLSLRVPVPSDWEMTHGRRSAAYNDCPAIHKYIRRAGRVRAGGQKWDNPS